LLRSIRLSLLTSPFSLEDPNDVSVLTGEEEAAYGWITTNHITGSLINGLSTEGE